jgi:PAS domain S-box-containing protein
MERNLPPFEAAVGLLAGLALASLATGLSLSGDPALRSVAALAREPWWWILLFGVVLSGGLGWIAGDQRRDRQRAHRTYQRSVESEFARLADQEWTTRAVVRASLDAVLLVDARGVVLDANPEAERLFGVGPDALVGRVITSLMPDRPTLVPGQELPPDVESASIRHADGSAVRVELRTTNLDAGAADLDGDGPPAGAARGLRVLTLREDALRQQLAASQLAFERRQDQTDEAARARSELLLEVDHGLRDDLSRLLRVTEELRGRGVAVEPVMVAAFGILERLERLLDVTLWDRAVGAPTREPVAVLALFDHVNDILAPVAQRWGRSVLLDVAPELGTIATDRSIVAGAVRALVREVFGRTDGDLVVEVSREPGRDHDWLLVTVSLGFTLPPAEAARLTALLEAAPATLPADRDAALALGQRLARHLGGRITLRPELSERGTTFGLSLPLSAPDRVRPSRVPVARVDHPTPP